MNLNISYNWLKEYVKTSQTANEFARELSLSGPSVEKIITQKPNFEKVIVGEIINIEPHPNADKLQLAVVNVGEEKLNIVCGAPNIAPGQKVPVALVGGRVGELEITKAKIRGVESQGMMCSQYELGLGDDHTGIYILPDYVKLGLPIEKIITTDDTIFDVEVTSNRPDAMCVMGIAREAAAILNEKFLYQESKPSLVNKNGIKFSVKNHESNLCPRYQAVVIKNVKVEPSPLWMQQRLMSAGLRPINNLVDITNYILLELGQPMHVFDYNKLMGHEINIRQAKKGEKILALDGKTYKLKPGQLVIADEKNPVAVAGVMGGELSAATESTEVIVLESANFNPVSVRKTTRTLNLYSDSSALYEKGLHPEATTPALMRAIELVMELAGGELASEVFDESFYKSKKQIISICDKDATKVLGVKIDSKKIEEILTKLGFKVVPNPKNGCLDVTIPWWRQNDMDGVHDLIEEIARIYGYHNLPSQLPAGQIPVSYDKNFFKTISKIKNILAGIGYSENYNYSFISEKLIKDFSLNLDDHIKIDNPLSGDFEYMRTSLLPGILQSVSENESHFNDLKIFEVGKVYKNKKDDLPDELSYLAIAINHSEPSYAFYEAKGAIETLMKKLNIEKYEFKEINDDHFEKDQVLELVVDGDKAGQIGIANQEILYLFGIKKTVALVNLEVKTLFEKAQPNPTVKPLAKYPSIELDISMEIEEKIKYEEIVKTISGLNKLIVNVVFLSQYDGKEISEGKKAIAIRVVYRNDKKTLTQDQAQTVHNKVVKKLQKEYNIVIR